MSTKKERIYKIKWKNTLIFTVLTVAVIGLAFVGVNIIKDYSHTKKILEKIAEVEVKGIVDDEFTTTIRPDSSLSKFDAYWDYIKLGLVEIDMAQLKRINTEAIGYIEVKGTNFSFPVVQSDNTFYKKHSFDKHKNSFGWIYLDETNSIQELDKNTIIYANKNYFNELGAKLNKLYSDEWKENDDNYVIKYYTNDYSTLWQIISVYKTKDKNYLKTSFESDEEFDSYMEESLKKTEIKFKGYTKSDDKILTITTNSRGSNIVIQAKLIKIRTEK